MHTKLKRLVPIACLLVIMIQSTSSLWILGSFYINQDYISKNVCVNRFDAMPICKGKCYLNNELKENEKKEQKLPDLKQKEINLFCQTKDVFTAPRLIAKSQISIYPQPITFHISNYHSSIFHPPQVS